MTHGEVTDRSQSLDTQHTLSFRKAFSGRVGIQSKGTQDDWLCNVDASKRKVACMLVALSHDLGNTSQVHPQDRDGSYESAEAHRTTACETGQRDGWLGKDFGFIHRRHNEK